MKTNFNELSAPEQFKVICSVKELKEKFDERISNNCYFCINEKLAKFECSLSDYSFGMYGNYWNVKSLSSFVYDALEYDRTFGLQGKTKKLLKYCYKIMNTNLFEFYANYLQEIIFKEEFLAEIKYFESVSYDLYNENFSENIGNELECFVEGLKEQIFIDDEQIIIEKRICCEHY